MLRLVVWIASLAFAGAFVLVGWTVPLGEHTLFGHLSAIGRSKESQELVRGTKDTVGNIRRRVGIDGEPGDSTRPGDAPGTVKQAGKVGPSAPATAPAPAAPPQERLTDDDRKQMRQLIGSARARPQK